LVALSLVVLDGLGTLLFSPCAADYNMEQAQAVTRIRVRAHDGNAMENFQVDSHEKAKTGNLGALTLMMSSRGASREIRVHLPEKPKKWNVGSF
jgi:hypothetical protein